MRLNNLTAFFIIVLLIAGCGGNGAGDPVETDVTANGSMFTGQMESETLMNRGLWGFWKVSIGDDGQAEVVYQHSTAMHFNVIRLLEVNPCTNCLTLSNIHFYPDNEIEVDLSLKHPFPGADKFSGFDVRGIFITNSDYTFPASGRSVSLGNGNPLLMNPDGYTALFNPTDFPEGVAPFPMLGYIKGKYCKSDVLTATLNPFIAYKKEAPRRIFYCGEGSTETLRIYSENLPFEFGYAVDANWVPVDGQVTDPVNDFPPEANAIEAYELNVVIENTYLDTSVGSFAPIQVLVFDHQGLDTISSVTVEVPGLFNDTVGVNHVGQIGDGFLFAGTLTNELGAVLGEYPLLVRINDTAVDGNLGQIDAWQVASVEIETQTSSNPIAIAGADTYIQIPEVPVHFFDDGSYDPDGGTIQLYEWDWDNDGIYEKTGSEADRFWEEAGVYYVQFRVTDDEGETDELDEPLEIIIDSGLGNLTGVVRDGENYEPITGVLAETDDGGYQSDTTEEDGIYSLIVLPPGQVSVDFSCPGYIPATGWFEIFPGETTIGDVVLLAPQSEEKGNITGMCIDATTADGIGSVWLEIREGVNNLTGPIIDTDISEILGQYGFYNLDPGTYTIYGEVDGYNPTHINVVAIGGETKEYDITFSPILDLGEIRIVLTWAELPRDIDSHLLTPEIEGQYYHIAFYSMGHKTFPPYAELDVDDVESYGPETITIAQVFPGRYKYFVHHWADHCDTCGTITTTSDAVVKVYDWTGLIAEFHAPATGEEGLWWEVFNYDGTTGIIQPVDQIRQEEPELDD